MALAAGFGPEGRHFVSGNTFIFIFWGEQRSCDGWWGAQRPVGRGNAPKKTGARSARARTRGQNPLVYNIVTIKAGSTEISIATTTVMGTDIQYSHHYN
jgi:hypothetical protein